MSPISIEVTRVLSTHVKYGATESLILLLLIKEFVQDDADDNIDSLGDDI